MKITARMWLCACAGFLTVMLSIVASVVAADDTEQSLLERARALFKPLPENAATPERPLTPERVALGRVLFFETRVVSVNLSSEEDRMAWFVFSLEACGELRKAIVINNVVPSGVKIDIPNLTDFLNFCRNCLVGTPGGA